MRKWKIFCSVKWVLESWCKLAGTFAKTLARSRRAICFLTPCIPWTSRRKRCNSPSYRLTAQNGGYSSLSKEGLIPYVSCACDRSFILQNIGVYVPDYMAPYRREQSINPLTPELNPSAQRCLTRFFTGDFASWTVHFVNICVKNQQMQQLFVQFINYVW
jgi:hypothetical protein